MSHRVLILGGTGEARALAQVLAARTDLSVESSLAGRVRAPVLPHGQVRIGGFGGVDGLAEYLRAQRIDVLIDATHPFAATITASALTATAQIGIPFLVLRRPGWEPEQGDRWHWVSTLTEAAAVLPELGERVFLTIGRQEVAEFAGLDRQWFLLRSVDPPQPPMPRRVQLLCNRGPFTLADERALLIEHRIDVLVTKNSGGELTAAKLIAARELGMPVLIQARPPAPDAPTEPTVAATVRRLEHLLGLG